jgi:acetyl/propionyl-CoA carboxylase alpha subunit
MRLVCGADGRDVVVKESGAGTEITIGGRGFRPEIEEAGPGVFVWKDGGRRETFHVVREGDAIHLFWRGVAYRLREEAESDAAAHRSAAGGLEAPMPGKVIEVRVVPGQRVKRGEELLVVEAMKMENALRAPRDGTVRSVAAKVGDPVSPGLVLVELE